MKRKLTCIIMAIMMTALCACGQGAGTGASGEGASNGQEQDEAGTEGDPSSREGASIVRKPRPGAGASASSAELEEEEPAEEEETVTPLGNEDEPALFPFPAEEEEDQATFSVDDLSDLTLYGTIFTFQGEHPNGTVIDAVGLKLYYPMTFETEEQGVIEVTEVHLGEDASYSGEKLSDFDGMKVCVQGSAFGSFTAWHLRNLVMLVEDIWPVEDDLEGEPAYSFVPSDMLGYYMDVDNEEDARAILNGHWFGYGIYHADGTSENTQSFSEMIFYYAFDRQGKAVYGDGYFNEADEDGFLPESKEHRLKAVFHAAYPSNTPVGWPANWYVELTGVPGAKGKALYATVVGKYLYVLDPGNGADTYTEYIFARSTKTGGEELEMTDALRREANLLLSNFTEQSGGAFSYDGEPWPNDLANFAMNYAKINTPDRVYYEDGYETMKLADCNRILSRNMTWTIPSAEIPYIDGGGDIYVDGDEIYREAADGESYNTFAVTGRMERGMGNVRFLYYDTYEVDIMEYLEQGIDDAYYDLTAEEAAANTSFKKISEGVATVELFEDNGKERFRMIENESIFRVDSVKGFFDALGDNRTIVFEAGTYDLTEEIEKGRLEEYYEDEYFYAPEGAYRRAVFDGEELVLAGFSNLKLRSGADGTGRPEIVCRPRYADVMAFTNCSGLTIEGLTIGHTPEEGYCAGDVLSFATASKIRLNDLDLYGCGTYGIEMTNTNDLVMSRSVIRDCSYGCITCRDIYDVRFMDTTFKDCREFSMFDCEGGHIKFDRCKFYRLNGAMLGLGEYGSAGFEGCLFDEDALEKLRDEKYAGVSVNIVP